RRSADNCPAAIHPRGAGVRALVRRQVRQYFPRPTKPGQSGYPDAVNDAQANGSAEIADGEGLRVRAHLEVAHAGGRLPDERDRKLWRGSVGNADDGESVVDAEGLATRAS